MNVSKQLQYAEERNKDLQQRNREIVAQMDQIVRQAAEVQHRIDALDAYDRNVQLIIASDANLQEAWDNFRVQYQLTARKELLETAKEKIAGEKEGICHGCKRPHGLPLYGGAQA